ncbi:MAG TPA: translocation/assembly module TamB domain-containing protein [Acetobacteraceae bacterium]|nr:translocation/assembly module TamB domain-containing protein [Acetobacteraceae bacterium]
MRRLLKYLAWIIGVLVAIPIVLIGSVLIGANTDPGRRMIETLIPRVSGGMVQLEGLRGHFPDRLRIRRLTVADPGGVWLTVNDAALDWLPLHLLEAEVAVTRLEAQSVVVDRLPAASSGGGGGGGVPPLHGVLSRLHIARLDIGPKVAGQPIALAVDGAGQIVGPDNGEVHLAITALQPRENAPLDHYLVEASMVPSHLHATISVAEGAHGLIAGLAQLPDLGAIAIAGSVDGPLDALATQATVGAGLLRGNLSGNVNLAAHNADLAFSVVAPAMTPGPGVAWSLVRLEGKVHGPFTAPEATASLAADGLTAAGATIGSVRAKVSGDATGKTELHATLDGLRVPGPAPAILANGPLTVDATVQLADANMPARFTVTHTLFSIDGSADTTQGKMRLTVPDLTPFAAIGGVGLQGHTALDIGAVRSGDTIDLTLTGDIGITGGMAPVPALIGDSGTIDLAASMHGEDVTLSRFVVKGANFGATANGQFLNGNLNADWTLALNDLAAIRPDLAGTIAARGHASGTPASLSISSDLTGNLAANGQRLEQVTAHVTLDGLPGAPTGRLTAGGTLFDAPLDVAISAERQDAGIHVVIDRTNWKSLTAAGTLDLPTGAVLPTGKLTLSMSRLEDLAPLIGRPIAGNVSATVDSSPDVTRIHVLVGNGSVAAAAAVAKAGLDATITNVTDHPVIDGALTLDGIVASGVRGSGRMTAKGPLDGLQLTLTASADSVDGMPARLDAAGAMNATEETLSLASLQGAWGRETIKLRAPAKIKFADGITIDRLTLGFRQGELTVAGKWGAGGTALSVDLTNLPADMLAAVAPEYAADGTIAGEARLAGSPARPEGTIHIHAAGLRLRTGSGRALPAAASTIDITLAGSNARVNANVIAGSSNVTVGGQLPLNTSGPMDVRIGGTVDLAMLNPLLAAQGRDVRGRVGLNLEVVGSPEAPKPGGTVQLTNGDVQDSSLGAHITGIAALVRFDGETIHLERLEGKAGQGTISGSGTVAITGTQAVDVSLRASNAKLLASDLITAVADVNLSLRGTLQGDLTVAGTVLARTVNIQIPEKLPPGIAVLPVRNAGTPPPKPPPPTPMPAITLNLTLDAPARIYVRGRGLDAELGGRVVFAGTAAAPVPQGGLNLRRGTFSLAGQTLNLTEGKIDFAGAPISNPSLKLVATAGNATLTSTLTISGSVRDPKITLSSVPDMPQDEILSQLLFNTAKSRLNPFQIAQIAAALAELSGVGPSVGDPLGGVRSALGLDQLSVGSDASGGTALQAGRYIAPGVRIGASQSATGTGTQATVQVDITKGLKLETTVGTGGTSATPGVAGSSNGTGVGLKYQFEY